MFTIILSLAAVAQQPSARTLLPTGRDAPGCALDVRRDSRAIDAAFTGLANLENGTAVDSHTVFEIGSVSKQFIGAGLAILAERGRLNLDDPIRRWLPELPPLYTNVTVAMLAHHTSGIRNWNNIAELTGRSEDSTGYDNAWVLAAVARQRSLNNVPGAEYLYSNSNFVLGAIIIERASGQELNDFFRNALFARLGMNQTEWRTDFRKIVPHRAQAYLPRERGGWQLDMPLNGVAGAGGLLSTVGDLQRWNAALADPAPNDKNWVAALLRPGTLTDGTQLRYGLGIETDPIVGIPAWSHAGSTGSYRAWLGYVPSQRLSIALLCNSGAVNTEDLGPEVAARFLPAPIAIAPGVAASDHIPQQVVGTYRNVANDAVVDVTADAEGIHLSGGPAFIAAGADRLTTRDGRRSATLTRNRAGMTIGITVTRIANSPVTLAREASWTPAVAELSQLVGSYVSPEIDGVQRITIDGDRPLWIDPAGTAHPLVPIYRNAFDAPDASWTLRFHADPGRPLTLDMSITRARRIRFERFRRDPRH